MKLQTVNNISFTQWIEQVSRAAASSKKLTTRNIPQNTDTSGKAEILIDIKKPLYQGFDAIVTYRQLYTTEAQQFVPEDNGNITDEMQTVSLNKQLDVLKYNFVLSVDESEAIYTKIDKTLDPNIKGLERIKSIMTEAILQDVISKGTFGGLTREGYTVTL